MKRSVWIGFAALCLLTGSVWLPEQALAPAWPPLLRLAFHDACAALVLACIALARRQRARLPALLQVAAWSAALFALPVVLSQVASGAVRSSTGLLLLGLIPMLTVFFESQVSAGLQHLLLPSVAGVGGLALIAQLALPSSAAGYGWFAAILVSVGLAAFAGIRLHTLASEVPLALAAATGSAAAALAGFCGWRLNSPGSVLFDRRTLALEIGWALAIDLPLLLLTFWLLRALRPTAFATRFLLAPLVTVLGGILVLHLGLEWTTWAGLLLLAAASWRLLSGREEPSLSLTFLKK